MTVATHNVFGPLLALALVTLLHHVGRREDFLDKSGPFFSLSAVALLLTAGLASAVGNGGDNFGMMRLLTWTVFLHVPLFLVGCGVVLFRRLPRVARGCVAAVILLGLVALDAFVIEPHWLQVSTVTVPSARIAAPLRVVVLADVQTDRPGRYEARVLQTAMAQNPDLILFAGDYVHLGRRSRSYESEVAALRDLMVEADLHAPLGIYAVAGNVDRPGVWTRAFADLPIVTMEDTTQVDLGPLVLTGLGLGDSFGEGAVAESRDAFHIVLGHSPNFSLAPVEADLLIAGHTHGGQVQLPFIGPLLTLSAVPRSWASGVTTIAPGKTLVVSRGIGMERANAPRLRFLCRPELVVIDLVPAD